MKKLILMAAVAVLGMVGVNAQSTGFQAGAHVGIPVGDADEYVGFNIGLDAAYLWEVADKFNFGVATGYDLYTAKEYEALGVTIKGKDFGYIPLSATAKYSFTDNFFGGLDLGYAFYVGEGNADGGFLYQPKAGYQNTSFDVFVFYKGISTGKNSNLNTVGLGAAYKF